MQNTTLHDLPTPCLLIEQSKLTHNIKRLSAHIASLSCVIRPHVKTHKSVEITQQIIEGGNTRGITVSTIKEAQHFFAAGYTDILYAVGIVPNKFAEVEKLMRQGCNIKVILDSLEAAELLGAYANENQIFFSVLIELDVDNHRAGVNPIDELLLDIARELARQPYITMKGVMTHAGGSYDCLDSQSQLAIAKQERDLSVLAATRIREDGIDCLTVSIGSTPTAFAIDDLSGITEIRAGVYALFDLVMAGLGVCSINDIALSVMGSIIGFQKDKHLALTDAGWMAMSRDRGTKDQTVDQGYGVICGVDGKACFDLILQSANQEHGIIKKRSVYEPSDESSHFPFSNFTLGDLVRILPNHACSTTAQFPYYYLVEGETVLAKLHCVRGW